MSHFAKVENGIVTNVLVIEQDVINLGIVGDPSLWIKTSYNTRGNVHYGQDGLPDGLPAVRGNYAGVGDIYDSEHDVFYASNKQFPSWVLNTSSWLWEAPFPMPNDEFIYKWDEESISWVRV
jgi:hypothetical protein